MKSPSPHRLFSKVVLQIISPTVEQYGFVRHKKKAEKFFTEIIFRKNSQYIKISASTYPTDYPYFYNIILGDGDSDGFPEYDWNSIALWRLKRKLNPAVKAEQYAFPSAEEMQVSLTKANQELLKYANDFMTGDMTLFYETRSERNKLREPYKIHAPNKFGIYETADDPKSAGLKKKYS